MRKRRRAARKPRKGPARKNEAIYDAIKAQPGRPIAELAEIAYPGDDNGNHKTRAILWNLKKKGLINNPRSGYWEATNQRQNSAK